MGNELNICYINMNRQDKDWDELIASSSPKSFFHTSSWLKLIEKSYGLKPHHLILKQGNEGILALPLFSSKIALHSPHIADYGGLCVNNRYLDDSALLNESFRRLDKEIGKIGKKMRVPAAYVRGFYQDKIGEDFLKQSGFKKNSSQFTYVLSNFHEEADVMNLFHKKTRNAVRKAIKEDVRVEFISSGDQRMAEYYRLHVLTKKKHGSDHFPKLFFDSLSLVQEDRLDILMAKHEDTYIAGLLGFNFNNRIHIFDNCSHPDYLKYNPNNLLYHTIIEKAKMDRMDVDFGRTSVNDKNLRQFKERWGSKGYPYDTYMKILPPVFINSLKLGFVSMKKRGIRGTFKRAFQRR